MKNVAVFSLLFFKLNIIFNLEILFVFSKIILNFNPSLSKMASPNYTKFC